MAKEKIKVEIKQKGVGEWGGWYLLEIPPRDWL